MGFDTGSNNGNGRGNNSGNNNNGIPDHKKAEGFLNLYLPRKDGTGRRKLGSIPLTKGNEYELALAKRLTEDPDAIKKLLAKLEVEYNSATPTAGADFDLD